MVGTGHVFISYKTEQRDIAFSIRDRLKEWGYNTWIDVERITPGMFWADEINNAIENCYALIGLVTPEAQSSRYVTNEWDKSIIEGKPFLPILFAPTKPHYKYIDFQYIDFTKDKNSAYTQLKSRLHILSDSSLSRITVDPYQEYLKNLFTRINDYLSRSILKRSSESKMSEPIRLESTRTTNVVDKTFEKPDEIDPLFEIDFGVTQKANFSNLDEVVNHFTGRALLLGDPGAGKTISLLYYLRDAILRRVQDIKQPVPILGTIATWNADEQTPIADWLQKSFGTPRDIAQLIESNQALLVLDGLDELGNLRKSTQPDDHYYDPRLRFIDTLRLLPATTPIVVSCRLQDYLQIGAKIPLGGAVTLSKLTNEQIADYLTELPDLWATLHSDPELLSVAKTPLLLSFLAFAYKQMSDQQRIHELEQLSDLKNSSGDLRDKIFEVYVRGNYDREVRKLKAKGQFAPFTYEAMCQQLAEIALENCRWLNQKNRIELEPSLADWASKLYLVVSDGKYHRFVHLRLRDYFAFPLAIQNLDANDSFTKSNAQDVLSALGDIRAIKPLFERRQFYALTNLVKNNPSAGIEFDSDMITAILQNLLASPYPFEASELIKQLLLVGRLDVVQQLVAVLSNLAQITLTQIVLAIQSVHNHNQAYALNLFLERLSQYNLQTFGKIRVMFVHFIIESIGAYTKLLSFEPDFTVVGYAMEAVQSLELIEVVKPQIIMINVNLPDMDGFSLSKMIGERFPDMKIVILSVQDSLSYLERALRVPNIVDYLQLPADMDIMYATLRQVAHSSISEHKQKIFPYINYNYLHTDGFIGERDEEIKFIKEWFLKKRNQYRPTSESWLDKHTGGS
jgi:CheY-like chemotaxis protein